MSPEHVRELFASFRPVTVRRMFGGAGIYADGVMFALLSSRGTIYLKVDENNAPDFECENLPPFKHEMNGIRRAMMSFRTMPERLYDDPDELAEWSKRALAAAHRAAGKRQTVTGGRRPKTKTTKRLTKR